MFTGIIETVGEVAHITEEGSNKHFAIRSSLAPALKVDQSVSHNGVCLTVTKVWEDTYQVTAVSETLKRSNLGTWVKGSQVNIERCMPADGRFDGHIVQGHVDQTGVCQSIAEESGSWLLTFAYQPLANTHLLVEKGSVTVNGVSLTCFEVTETSFQVAIIPYTYEYTNFNKLSPGDPVNLEFDIIGKYIARILGSRSLK